jgi:hypothetical protein
MYGEDEDWSGPCTDDSESDDNESQYDEGGSRRMMATARGETQTTKVDLQTG